MGKQSCQDFQSAWRRRGTRVFCRRRGLHTFAAICTFSCACFLPHLRVGGLPDASDRGARGLRAAVVLSGASRPRICGPSACVSRAAAPAASASHLELSVAERHKPGAAKRGAGSAKFRFGAISDVQYADIDDAWNFRGTELRRYRSSLEVLRSAIEDWRQEVPRLDFIVDLGDMIDQQCETLGMSESALAAVLDEWKAAPATTRGVHHLLGNHELYNFNRSELATRIEGMIPWYRSFSPAEGWHVIILDPYDVNAIEMNKTAAEEGLRYLSARNPNDLRAPRGTVNLMEGLEASQRRFVPMGGAVGREQMEWLEGQLRNVSLQSERCILLTHLPLKPGAAVDAGLLWNYEEVLDVIGNFSNSSCCTVPLVLAGHDHKGGHFFDSKTQTAHVTLPSPLSTDEGGCAHATIEVWDDRIEMHGKGLVKNRSFQLASLQSQKAPGAEK